MITVYEWFDDIQIEIEKILGCKDNDQFRDYEQVIGGDHIDCWHVLLSTVIPDNGYLNGTTQRLYVSDKFGLKTLKPREMPILAAYDQVIRKLDPDSNGILVYFEW